MVDRRLSPLTGTRAEFRRAVAVGAALLFAAAAAGGASPPGAPASLPSSPPQALPGIPPEYSALAARLHKQFPEYPIESIRPSAVEGVVEVLFGGNQIIYSDVAGQHIFNGHLFDLESHRDLTDERLEEVTRIDVKRLPLVDAFDVVHGNGKRQVYVFEDPDCPFCRKFEEQLPKVDNLTLHVFLYPLTSIHPHAYQDALGVWCSKDRQKAWQDKMLRGIDPPAAKCDNPLDRNLALGEKLHIDGTPTLIFANGRPHAGTLSASELEQLLAQNSSGP